MARAFSLGGLPNSGLAFNAPHPPRRYCANHPYIVRRLILKDRCHNLGIFASLYATHGADTHCFQRCVIRFASIILFHAALESCPIPTFKKKVQLLMDRLIPPLANGPCRRIHAATDNKALSQAQDAHSRGSWSLENP
jgi:hypothetical protein